MAFLMSPGSRVCYSLLPLTLVIFLDGQLMAQEIPAARAVRTTEAIVVDGELSESAWSLAEPVNRFLQRDPLEGNPATERTDVRIVFDAFHIYFGVLCYDSRPAAIRATELRRDNPLATDDIFEIVLDTFHDHRNSYLFRINPLGTQYDETITNEGQSTNSEWDEAWQVSTRVTEEGWSAEIAIPFKAMRFGEPESTGWGINFHRTIKSKNEEVFWSAHNRGYRFTEVSRAGHLEGLSEIQGFRVRIKPYLATGVSRSVDGDLTSDENLSEIGIEDIKYMLTPQLAFDFAVNPDFAQIDVDAVQTNLTRFSLLFPERREFFQEGTGTFRIGTADAYKLPELLLFNSRSIGLSEDRQAIPLYGGMKLTGKGGPLELGILNMQSRRAADHPSQNFSVARVKVNVLGRSYVGGIYTRNTNSPLGGSNQLLALDANFTIFQYLSVHALTSKTFTQTLGIQNRAHLGRVAWISDLYQFVAELSDIESNFRPELGFVSRYETGWKGLEASYLQAGATPRPALSGIRQLGFTGKFYHFANQEGLLESRNINFELSTEFQNGDSVEAQYAWLFERLLEPFIIRGGGTVPEGRYSFGEWSIDYTAFGGRPVSGHVELRRGGFYNGNRTKLTLGPSFKPTKYFSFEPSYVLDRVNLPDARFGLHELNAVMNYSFTQKWLTRTTMVLNSQDQEVGVNFRLNYILHPGSDLFVVFNEGRSYGAKGGLENRALIVKITHSLDY